MTQGTLSLRNYIREVILEASKPNADLAVVMQDRGHERAAAFYDANILLDVIKGGRNSDKKFYSYQVSQRFEEAIDKAVVGFISIKAPHAYPCNGAWSIVVAWGPGIGEAVYGTGYVMSPNHTLVPDRSSVSDSAAGAWKKAFGKSGIIKTPIDSVEDHRDGVIHDPRRKNYLSRLGFDDHTEDPADDCKLYRAYTTSDPEKFEHLNFYYDASPVIGRYSQMLESMKKRHEEVLDSIESTIQRSEHDINRVKSFVPVLEEDIFGAALERGIDAIEPAL